MKPTTLAAGLGASLPVIVSTVHALDAGVVPAGDRAIIALRAYEVFTAHTPLVGQYSASSLVSGAITHSPGPLLYWLLAIPARVGAPGSLALVMGIVNILATVIAVALARRRGGVPMMIAAALALILLSRSWSPETLYDIWNPSAGLYPFTLVLFLSWSLACGEYRLLVLTALAASFVIQSELTFLAPTVGAVAVGLCGLFVWRLRGRAPTPPAPGPGVPTAAAEPMRARSPRIWPWALAALLVLAACWSAPVIDELQHSPGNLTLLARAAEAHDPKQGAAVGWHAVVRAVGVPPWWLRVPGQPFERFAEVLTPPGSVAAVSTLVLLGALLLALFAGLLAGSADLAAGAAIGLSCCFALGAVAASTPTRPSIASTLGYTMWWGSQAGMWVWLMVGFAGAKLARATMAAFAGRRRPDAGRAPAGGDGIGVPGPSPRHARVPALASFAAVAVVLAAGAAVAGAQSGGQDEWSYRPIGTIDIRLHAALGPSVRTVLLVGAPDTAAFDFRTAAAFSLRSRGVRVLDPAAAPRLNSAYELGAARYQAVIRFLHGGEHRPAGRPIAVIPAHIPGGRPLVVTLEAVQPAGPVRRRSRTASRRQASSPLLTPARNGVAQG